jgi:hypothetical protein
VLHHNNVRCALFPYRVPFNFYNKYLSFYYDVHKRKVLLVSVIFSRKLLLLIFQEASPYEGESGVDLLVMIVSAPANTRKRDAIRQIRLEIKNNCMALLFSHFRTFLSVESIELQLGSTYTCWKCCKSRSNPGFYYQKPGMCG